MTLSDALEKVKTYAEKNAPAIIFLKGDLGAGKTHFVNEFAKEIGVFQQLPSPTFTFLQEYNCSWLDKKKVIHCDFYRIEPEKAEKTLEQIGFWDYIEPAHIVFIEWPERAGTQLEDLPHLTVTITLLETGERDYVAS